MLAKEASRTSDNTVNKEFITTLDIEELFKAQA
jgi:hypothetical protein